LKLKILPSTAELARATAEDFVEKAQVSIEAHGSFKVALTGGSTPREAYALLATDAYRSRIDWARTYVFWGDERCVPPDHEASNFRMAREALLDHVPIPADNVFRMRGEDPPQAAAAGYEQLLKDVVGDRFHLIHLGVGADAHIASLFPGSPALHEAKRRVYAQYVETFGMWRITFTPVVINRAASVTFIVAGKQKARAVGHVLEGPHMATITPAQIVAPTDGEVLWLIDSDAASNLNRRPT
jgi:6-phosphogluconolactonase